MQIARKIDNYLARLEEILIVLTLSLMILLSFGQVILRSFFNQDVFWADTFLRQTVLWVWFLGTSIAVLNNRHRDGVY